MVQSVELLLDDATDLAVRRQWTALGDAGLPSQGRHTGPSNRPHVTLAVAGSVPDVVEAALPDAVRGLPLDVLLGSPVVFGAPGRRILVRLVVPSRELLALQAVVAGTMAGCPGLVAQTTPGRWTPHVTLARGLTDAQVGEALTRLGRVRDLDGRAVAARRWDGQARREWPLGGP
ncbi:MAG: 2'-5' RNA ligase family protein [Actinomycetes bacterium]